MVPWGIPAPPDREVSSIMETSDILEPEGLVGADFRFWQCVCWGESCLAWEVCKGAQKQSCASWAKASTKQSSRQMSLSSVAAHFSIKWVDGNVVHPLY